MPNDIQTVYADYQMYLSLAEEKKKEFNALAKIQFESGNRDFNDEKYLCKVTKSNDKYDVTMLKTIHPEIYDAMVDSGKVSIKMGDLKEYADQIEDCLVNGDPTEYYIVKAKDKV